MIHQRQREVKRLPGGEERADGIGPERHDDGSRRPPPTPSGADAVRAQCEAMLRGNWREGVGGRRRVIRLHAPEPRALSVAVVLGLVLRGDRVAALRSPRSRRSSSRCSPPARGRLHRPHDLLGRPVPAVPAPDLQRHRRRTTAMTATIQPPVLAWAWRIAVGDPAAEPAIVAHYEGLGARARPRRRRPALDPPARRVRSRRLAAVRPDLAPPRPRPARLRELVRRNRRLGFDLRRIAQAGGPGVLRGRDERAARRSRGWRSDARRSTPAIVERLYDERDRAVPAAGAARPPPSIPAHLGRAGPARAARPARARSAGGWSRSTCSISSLLAALAPPSVAADEPAFSLRGRAPAARRNWRGPTWVNAAWLLWLGLVRLGYDAQASVLATDWQDDPRGGTARVLRPLHRAWDGATDFGLSPPAGSSSDQLSRVESKATTAESRTSGATFDIAACYTGMGTRRYARGIGC